MAELANRPHRGNGKGIRWLREHISFAGSECLMWPFGKCNGYGVFGYLNKNIYAHRYMCEQVHGPCPGPEYEASHSCGRGHLGCVNPAHISWKTKSENQIDRNRHGTQNRGRFPRLTERQAAEIRALRGKMPQREIAKQYGTSRANVSLIHTGNSWTGERSYTLNPKFRA